MSFIDAGSAAAANGFACAAEAGFGAAFYTGLFANQNLDWSDSQLNQLAERASGSVPAEFSTCVSAPSPCRVGRLDRRRRRRPPGSPAPRP